MDATNEMSLTDLATFVSVAENESLSGAARALGVPKSTVSRRVRRLEDALGVSLVVRGGRAVGLTDDGERLGRRCAVHLSELAQIGEQLRAEGDEARGTLRLTCAPDLARQSSLARMLAIYRSQCPRVRVELVLTNRVVDLVEENFDLALRPNAGRLRDSATLKGRQIAEITPKLYAAASYVERAGLPSGPEELANHDIVAHSLMMRNGIALRKRGTPDAKVYPLPHTVAVNDFAMLEDLVRSGVGIGPLMLGEDPVGSLVHVLPEHVLGTESLWVVWPASRHLSPRVRSFVELASQGALFSEMLSTQR